MTGKKNKHFFCEFFRFYKKTGDVFREVKQQYLNAQPYDFLGQHQAQGPSAREQPLQSKLPPVRPDESNQANKAKQGHEHPLSNLQESHFERQSAASNGNSHVTAQVSSKKEFNAPLLEGNSALFVSRQSLSSSLQGEVRELLRNIHFTQTSSSLLAQKSQVLSSYTSKSLSTSPNNTSSNSSHTPLFQEGKVQRFNPLPGSTTNNLNLETHLPLSQASVNSLNTALNVETGGTILQTQFALQSVFTSLQNYFPSQKLNASYNSASLGNIYPSALGQSEGLHLIQWGIQLGLPPQALGVLLPFIVQFQEAAPHAQPALQGLFVLFSLLSGFSQMGLSSLTWPYLKGMMILENNMKLNPVQSPLLDELGALLSTSKRRLRKEARKRISNLDKVSRKDAYLAETDTQENEEDVEALIDLWPKKESNNSSTAFYYM